MNKNEIKKWIILVFGLINLLILLLNYILWADLSEGAGFIRQNSLNLF